MPEMTSNMPQPESDHCGVPAAPDGTELASETRIDRPHVVPGTAESGAIRDEALDEALAQGSDLVDSASAGMELRRQADELAAYLRSRLKDLEQRESLLNTRSAQLDASLRDAQATINERQADLARRERELADREDGFTSQPEARQPTVTESQPSSLELRAEQLERREAALAARQKELGRVYARAFDMCTAAEELFKELPRGADRAALTKALRKVHGLSTEHHRAQGEELAEKKKRLENVRLQLAKENQRLQEHDKQLRQWVQQRELTLERRAAQLAAKEAKLRRG